MKKRKDFLKLLQSSSSFLLGGVYDGLSASLAEKSGFKALWASGFCISASKKIPDVGLVTMAEHLAKTKEINQASTLPVIADVDDGFGDIINVSRMIKEYEEIGCAGICMEDNHHPKRCSLIQIGSRKLVSPKEFANKIKVAKASQEDPDFQVIARTEALVAGMGMEEAKKRAHLYVEAGCDMILLHCKDANPKEVQEFGETWDLDVPLVSVPTMYPTASLEDLEKWGYKMVIFANQSLRASVMAMEEIFKEMIQTGKLETVEKKITPLKEIFSLVGYNKIYELEKKYS